MIFNENEHSSIKHSSINEKILMINQDQFSFNHICSFNNENLEIDEEISNHEVSRYKITNDELSNSKISSSNHLPQNEKNDNLNQILPDSLPKDEHRLLLFKEIGIRLREIGESFEETNKKYS